MTQNQIKYQELEESRYHNRVMEQETKRTNLANEQLKHESNAINDAHYMRSDAETQRSNMAREAETMRSNLAQESETKRHNTTTETIQWFTANSEARLRESNIKLNSVLEDKYVAETNKTKAEKFLTDAKIVTEEDYTRPKLLAETNYTKKQADTEVYRHDLVLTEAAKNYNDLLWYGTNRTIDIFKWAGNTTSDLGKAYVNYQGSVFNSKAKLETDLTKQGLYTPQYNYAIQ